MPLVTHNNSQFGAVKMGAGSLAEEGCPCQTNLSPIPSMGKWLHFPLGLHFLICTTRITAITTAPLPPPTDRSWACDLKIRSKLLTLWTQLRVSSRGSTKSLRARARIQETPFPLLQRCRHLSGMGPLCLHTLLYSFGRVWPYLNPFTYINSHFYLNILCLQKAL